MSRLSREEKREVQQEGRPAPVDVRVAGAAASVDGVPLLPGPGEEPQQAVLNHLQRLARTTGRPVLATVHDTRIGYVVPLQVDLDGSSSFTGDPVRLAAPAAEPREQPAPKAAAPAELEPVPEEAVQPAAPAFPHQVLQAVPQPPAAPPAPPAPPTALPAVAPPLPPAPGTVQPPTGVFGPPPVMSPPAPAPASETARASAPASAPEKPVADRDPDPDLRSTPTPARGFDAVAEEVLGDEPVTLTAEGAALLTEPVARINEAVRTGRIDAAAELAERTVAEAAAVLGAHHTEVLHLGELTAYISYLAGDPVRAFHLSLDLARQRGHARDGEAAYGNVRSAATAWRAVRDPEHGLRLGRELIDLWAQLTAEGGPAADDAEELESARARMARLTERARRAAQNA
ncbi:MAG: tetratricopeptide repeat protein [Streptomyces sp.]|uniref:tetratricopeptide repeat protein n=1 Tax=Streptomyces sp. TaxID=1931 RepID=UPI0025F26B04|nr:tetratricopeptide repeat protein [Streptomyces sp.]MBW8799140.1 tetratricopeptide repeat protein [Streptomyces sp.]